MMVGRDLALAFPPRAGAIGPALLSVENLSAPGEFSDVSFTAHAGEILGFGGITGSGQQAIARALFGLLPASGSITVDGRAVKIANPAQAIEQGIVYLPADRSGEGMFLPHSIAENIALPHVKDWARLGILDAAREREAVTGQIDSLAVKTPSPRQAVGLLSGGNQQKVAFARWLLSRPKVFIFDEPTQGVDVGTKLEIYGIIRDLAARGSAVIVVSSDVLELIGLSDRILIAANRRLVDEVPGAEATEARIVGSAVGLGAATTAATTTRAGSVPTAGSSRRRRIGPLSLALRRYGPVLFLLAMTVAVAAYTAGRSPYFLTERNMASLAIQLAPLLIVSLGQLAVVLVGGIDLSVGPAISLTTAIASVFLIPDPPLGMAMGILLCLLAGLAVGLLNGFLIRVLRLPDLIATLASFSIVAGLALIVRPAPGGLLSGDFTDGILLRIGHLPLAFAGGGHRRADLRAPAAAQPDRAAALCRRLRRGRGLCRRALPPAGALRGLRLLRPHGGGGRADRGGADRQRRSPGRHEFHLAVHHGGGAGRDQRLRRAGHGARHGRRRLADHADPERA